MPLSWTFCLGGGKCRKYTVSVKLTVTFRAAALNATDSNCIDTLETVEALGLNFGVTCFVYLLVFYDKVYKIKNSQHGMIRGKDTLFQVLGTVYNLQNPCDGSREPMPADCPLTPTHCAMVHSYTHIHAYICMRINKC